ncbi:RBBP9/YdeN family alpha/beta hydrolase [Segnochrobactrum spirostomi]|uniref:Alpha/beta hydrolase n=1 Tax=Segnochrobactrum spirostomi TaxID=2608987 RepID=A0A6A7Y2D4_9HYPH|nr:alpha/beta hydrolase [Segnochrobactrum spirostomi]MQT12537.1 alpha/beta hydrolase [Segnochrobactrum spirostomi]
MSILILPGLNGSSHGHWQRHFVETRAGARIVEQRDWDRPERTEWVATLSAAILQEGRPVVLVAHSLAVALVAHLAATPIARHVAGALLVAPADVETPARTPEAVRNFAPLPRGRLPFRSTLIASRDDPYMDQARARTLAEDWGSLFVDLGNAGHINAASGHGPWPEGLAHLDALVATAGRATA